MAINLENVPPEKQTYQMCMESVQAVAEQLRYVNPKLQTEELCLTATRHISGVGFFTYLRA